ncbi:unnamed protein product [Cylindrotheca closterium]|uniref:Uncharacterized protein n=1 Tax=Cylindrotheca closterium TaxID=2856 RepID=A0AAD2FKT6_9STRA|nr:unnamed protein product [Cylindrotheca closterium]
MSLLEPQCAWISGPHKGGKHDLTIFREGGLKQKLKRWKQAIVDRVAGPGSCWWGTEATRRGETMRSIACGSKDWTCNLM